MWLVLSLLACNKDMAEVEWPEDDPETLVRVTMPVQGGGQLT